MSYPSSTSSSGPRITVCGDGVAELPEECDDGNTVSGDGCSAICRVEPCFTPPSSAFNDAEEALREQLIPSWFAPPFQVTGTETWFPTPTGGMWMWWPTVDLNTEGERSAISARASGMVLQEWRCNNRWERIADTAAVFGSWSLRDGSEEAGYHTHSGTSIISYRYDLTEQTRVGSVEQNFIFRSCSPEPPIPVANGVVCKDSISKETKTWDGARWIFVSERTESHETEKAGALLQSKSSVSEAVINNVVRLAGGEYELISTSEELLKTQHSFSPSGSNIGELISSESSTKGVSETYRKVDRSRKFFESGLPSELSFAYRQSGPTVYFDGESRLSFREEPFGRAEFFVESDQADGVLLNWDAAGNLTTPIDDDLREAYSEIQGLFIGWGDATPWPILP